MTLDQEKVTLAMYHEGERPTNIAKVTGLTPSYISHWLDTREYGRPKKCPGFPFMCATCPYGLSLACPGDENGSSWRCIGCMNRKNCPCWNPKKRRAVWTEAYKAYKRERDHKINMKIRHAKRYSKRSWLEGGCNICGVAISRGSKRCAKCSNRVKGGVRRGLPLAVAEAEARAKV